ncbi:MspA family porin [uncultured Mycolicibacterium sp.]|uniref:MspA family porin n=1 Tax=uncultured Mycolicibacterium sp. TaxID=2320817 RepID=UPI002624760C|nr:MspA family porin [uncultured Mycolicibacterium sp.]
MAQHSRTPRARRALAGIAGLLLAGAPAVPAGAQPDEVAPGVEPVASAAEAEPPEPGPPGFVPSPPPATTTSPDGWTLTLSARDETRAPVPPLTTAVSSREYVVGGLYTGSLSGPDEGEPPHGVLEVGYQIGCGIDMSTSQGVTLAGSAGITPSLGFGGVDFIDPFPEGLAPVVLSPIGGSIAVGLKPGIVNVVPVTKKEFTGFEPWVMVSGFRIKIDGCVGQSFIRSYAFLTRSTRLSDAIIAYYGETTVV